MNRQFLNRWPWLLAVLGLPLAAAGLLLVPNEHQHWGGAGVDCDGPLLLAFAVPAMLIYLACCIPLARRALVARHLGLAVTSLLCLVLVGALAANSLAAVEELRRPEHRASCN